MPDVTVAALPAASRHVLRVRGTDGLGTMGGFDLSGPINSARGTEERFAARLGPDEWLIVAPAGEAVDMGGLWGRFYSLVDVTDRSVAFAVAGSEARHVLASGIALDLERGFPEGSATRTLFGKAEVVLVLAPGASAYRVECWRSYGDYVEAFLREVAQEFA